MLGQVCVVYLFSRKSLLNCNGWKNYTGILNLATASNFSISECVTSSVMRSESISEFVRSDGSTYGYAVGAFTPDGFRHMAIFPNLNVSKQDQFPVVIFNMQSQMRPVVKDTIIEQHKDGFFVSSPGGTTMNAVFRGSFVHGQGKLSEMFQQPCPSNTRSIMGGLDCVPCDVDWYSFPRSDACEIPSLANTASTQPRKLSVIILFVVIICAGVYAMRHSPKYIENLPPWQDVMNCVLCFAFVVFYTCVHVRLYADSSKGPVLLCIISFYCIGTFIGITDWGDTHMRLWCFFNAIIVTLTMLYNGFPDSFELNAANEVSLGNWSTWNCHMACPSTCQSKGGLCMTIQTADRTWCSCEFHGLIRYTTYVGLFLQGLTLLCRFRRVMQALRRQYNAPVNEQQSYHCGHYRLVVVHVLAMLFQLGLLAYLPWQISTKQCFKEVSVSIVYYILRNGAVLVPLALYVNESQWVLRGWGCEWKTADEQPSQFLDTTCLICIICLLGAALFFKTRGCQIANHATLWPYLIIAVVMLIVHPWRLRNPELRLGKPLAAGTSTDASLNVVL